MKSGIGLLVPDARNSADSPRFVQHPRRLESGQVPGDVEEDDLVLLTESEAAGYDILPHVREAVILELPMRYLCSEECKGLCARCGANLNRGRCACGESEDDERWAPLKKLLNNDEFVHARFNRAQNLLNMGKKFFKLAMER